MWSRIGIPRDPNLIYALNPHGIGMDIRLFDVRDQSLLETIDLSGQILGLGGAFATADRAHTGEEGRPSRDGSNWCMGVFNGEQFSGMVAYDLNTRQIIAQS